MGRRTSVMRTIVDVAHALSSWFCSKGGERARPRARSRLVPTSASPSAPEPPAPTPVPVPVTIEDRLRKLEELRIGGLITDDEYASQRRQIIGSL